VICPRTGFLVIRLAERGKVIEPSGDKAWMEPATRPAEPMASVTVHSSCSQIRRSSQPPDCSERVTYDPEGSVIFDHPYNADLARWERPPLF